MSSDDSAIWRARAAEMRALVDKAEGRISKELLLRIAEDYEWFARSIEQRPNRVLPPEDAVPAEVRPYSSRPGPTDAPPLIPDDEIPNFLKRAPAKTHGRLDDDEN